MYDREENKTTQGDPTLHDKSRLDSYYGGNCLAIRPCSMQQRGLQGGRPEV